MVSSAIRADTIDFEGLPVGTIVSELSAGNGITGDLTGIVKVVGHNTIFPDTNAAVVLDGSCYCPLDRDLRSPNEDFGGPGIGVGGEAGSPYQNDTALGNILILDESLDDADGDGLVDDPNDADRDGYMDFDFSCAKKNQTDTTVTINSLTIMDVELKEGESPALIEFFGPDLPPTSIAVVDTDDNGVATIDLIGLSGVSRMRVNFKGSGGFAGAFFEVNRDREPSTCWITTGGFQNAGVQSGGKDFTFGGNVGPPPSGSWEVIDHNTGDNFHSHDVHIVECLDLDGTGPQQPGGKKGFNIDFASFEGTGRLNGVPGYPFVGFVIDGGEPANRNGNDPDYFEIVVFDPVTSVVVFAASGNLDGGNVQIHPPNGGSNH